MDFHHSHYYYYYCCYCDYWDYYCCCCGDCLVVWLPLSSTPRNNLESCYCLLPNYHHDDFFLCCYRGQSYLSIKWDINDVKLHFIGKYMACDVVKKQVAYFWQEESKIAWWFVIKFLLLLGTNCVPLCGEIWWWWWGGIIVWWNGLNGCAAVAVCGGNGVEVWGWSQWSLMVGQVKHDGRWRRLSVVVLSGV